MFTKIRRNTGIKNSLLLLFLLHLVVCQAFHQYQDFMETEILSSTPIFENPHHDDLVATRESECQNLTVMNASFLTIPPPADHSFKQASHNSLFPLFSDPTSAILRC